jgi:hypothetical protein
MTPKSKPQTWQTPLMATMRLELPLDLDHELVRLAQVERSRFAAGDGPLYCSDIRLRQSYRKLEEWAFRKHGGHAKAKRSSVPSGC